MHFDKFYSIISIISLTLGLIISFLLIMNSFLKRVLLQTNKLIENFDINQMEFKKISPIYLLWKRIFDIAVIALSMPLLLPLIILISIVIKIDSSGPIFYYQKRCGLNGKFYNRIKFRTMRTDIDYESFNVTPSFLYKLAKDPRVTQVGRFLRSTDLDQIPGIFNILKGDISFVGTNDLPEKIYSQISPTIKPEIMEALRHIKPGLVSLWVVSYDYRKVKNEHLLLYDLVYLNKMSFFFDLAIITRTIIIGAGLIAGY